MNVVTVDYEMTEIDTIKSAFIFYIINISLGDKVAYQIKKRYNALQEYNKYAVRAGLVNVKDAPKFPSFSLIDFRPHLEIAEERRPIIETYLNHLLNEQDVLNDLKSRVFFEFDRFTIRDDPLNVLILLPDYDFDPTEVVLPWKTLTSLGMDVYFSTENGDVGTCEMNQLQKEDITMPAILASSEVKYYYSELLEDERFNHPMTWDMIVPEDFQGIIVPGGHAPGMKQILDAEPLKAKLSLYWDLKRPIGAIGQGVLLLARTKNSSGEVSILNSKRTTTLTKSLALSVYALVNWKYRTEPFTDELEYPYLEDEVKSHLKDEGLYRKGPSIPNLKKDSLFSDSGAFAHIDRNYISSRWTGDSWTFSIRFAELMIRHYNGVTPPIYEEETLDQVPDQTSDDGDETLSL